MRRRVPTCLLLVLALEAFICAVASSQETGEEHFRKAAALAREGEIERAEREYLAGLRLESNSFAAYNNLGVLYLQQKQFQRAIEAFANAEKLDPNDGEVEFNLGLAYYESGDRAHAMPHLRAANDSTHAQDIPFLLGACYFAANQWPEAIKELELYRARVPDNPEMLFMLEHAYSYTRNAKASLEAASALLKSHPDSPYTHEILGEAYDQQGDAEHAIQEFQRAVQAAPSISQLHFMLGYVCWRWKRYGDAAGPFEDEIRINPSFPESYFYLGDIALRRGENYKARSLFEKALQLDPSYGDAILGVGKTEVKAGHLNEAIAAFRKAETELRDATEAQYYLGRTLIRAGRKQEGEKELAKVKSLRNAEQQQVQQSFNGVPVGEKMQGPRP